MNNILKVTDKASDQLKKIIESAPSETIGVLIGIDKSGCNGYSYKLDFVKKTEVEKFEFVQKDNLKIFIDPKATMFLLEVKWIILLINYHQDLYLKIQTKKYVWMWRVI